MIPTHTCPSCVQTAEPNGLLGRFHFTSSAISGSASWTILRSFASIAPRQSRVFAINSSTGPARVMSAPHSFVYRVSAVPAAHGADVIASRRAAIDARVAPNVREAAHGGVLAYGGPSALPAGCAKRWLRRHHGPAGGPQDRGGASRVRAGGGARRTRPPSTSGTPTSRRG